MVCEKAFSQSYDLKRHKISHTREKTFKCMFCEKIFCKSSHLKRRKLSNTGKKPFNVYSVKRHLVNLLI